MSGQRGPEGREGHPGREGQPGREGLPGIPGDTGHRGDKGEKGKPGRAISNSIKLSFILLTIIFFLTAVGFAWVLHDMRELSNDNRILIDNNSVLIADNTAKHIFICEKSYEGIYKISQLFVQPSNIDRVNDLINELKNDCKRILSK